MTVDERPAPDHYAPRRYRVRHATIYTYDDDVEACYERGFLRPLETWSQQVVSNQVIVQAGIRHVVYMSDRYHDTDACRASRILLQMAGVELRKHIPRRRWISLQLAKRKQINSSSLEGPIPSPSNSSADGI